VKTNLQGGIRPREDITSYRFIGVDTHKDQHTAAVIDCGNRCLEIVEVPNNPNCFDQFIEQVKVYTDSNSLAFGLEDTGGLGRSLACFLSTSGMKILEVNPTLTERRRKARPHPEKSDPQDALAIAKILLSEFETLPNVSTNDLPCSYQGPLFTPRLSCQGTNKVEEQVPLPGEGTVSSL